MIRSSICLSRQPDIPAHPGDRGGLFSYTTSGDTIRPFWFVCPAYPVPKHLKKSVREVKINGGLHMQGVAFMPLITRLKSNDLALDIEENWRRYIRPCVSRLHAVRITRSPRRTMRYLLKSIERGRTS